MPEGEAPYSNECAAEYDAVVAAQHQVEPLSDDTLDSADKATLEAKFDDYVNGSAVLEGAVANAQRQFTETDALYKQVFDKVELLDVLLARLEALGLAERPADARDAAEDESAEVSVLNGILTATGAVEGALAVGAFAYQTFQYVKARRPAVPKVGTVGTAAHAGSSGRVAKAADAAADTVDTARRASAVSGGARVVKTADAAADTAKVVSKARLFKAGGAAVLGVVGVGMAIYGIQANIRQEQQLLQFYRDNLRVYRSWYASAQEAFLLFCAGRRAMQAEIDGLKASLGLAQDSSTDARLLEILNGTLIGAGEMEAKLAAAGRMVCNLSITDTILYLDLPDTPEVQNLLSNLQLNCP